MARIRPVVALIDDDESVRRALHRLLVVAGFDVEVHVSADSFLRSLDKRLPDCVVLDVYMPLVDGLDVQADLKGRDLSVPIVFITAHDDPAAQQRAMAGGAIAYLRKPFPEAALLNAIDKALAIGGSASASHSQQ